MSSQDLFNKLISQHGGKAIVAGRCYINKSLSGAIDTSELKGRGINELWFSNGEITDLHGLPDGLKRLVVRNNQLSSIPVLEIPNLAILDAESNNITDIDLSQLKELTYANLAKNQLRRINELPPKLVEIVVDYNPALNDIDLEGADACRKLSCKGKPVINIRCSNKNCNIVADDGARIRSGGGPKKTHKASEAIVYDDPDEAFDNYYKLKTEYEDSIKNARRKILNNDKMPRQERIKKVRQLVPKCVSCGKNGGTIFGRSLDKVLTAQCAAAHPCELNIEIQLGDDMEPSETIAYFEKYIEKIKSDIVRLKLNTLFNYVTEEKSVEAFTKLSGNLNNPTLTKQLSEYKHFFDNQMNNPETNALLRTTMSRVYERLADIRRIKDEYRQNSENKRLLKDIGHAFVEVNTDIQMIRRLRYPIMEMVEDRDGCQALKQKPYDLQSFVEPVVVHFQYGKPPDESVYAPNSPEYNPISPPPEPFVIIGDTIEWNNMEYKAAWETLPKKHQAVLMTDEAWLTHTLDKMSSNKTYVSDFIMPKDAKIPPLSGLNFGNEALTELVSQLTEVQRSILSAEVKPKMTGEEKQAFLNILKPMLQALVKY
jgi:hypothetical protein